MATLVNYIERIVMAKANIRNPYVALLTKLNGGVHRKTNKALRKKQKQVMRKEMNKLLD